ncbi:MAG TPA: hypothetical protein VGV59_10180 [Pyrinomonadaceae bacterium]|nr:hypothetical protein [Pyrinomonadaceae bacterium]
MRETLQRTWYHAGEEDTATEKVYKAVPPGGAIPPGRARDPFTLNPDGTLVEGVTAPNDAQTESAGTWKLEGDDQLAFYTEAGGEASRVMKIASVTKDRLLVKK